LIFPNRAGGPVNQANDESIFFPALKVAGVPGVRFHDLRHTYTSLLIDQGENIKYIQKQLGHPDPTTMWNPYAHLMKTDRQELARKIEDRIFKIGSKGKGAKNNGSKMAAGAKG
jgi:integrase